MILVDPLKITNFERNLKEKEAFLLFGICVAGKEALQISVKLFDFLYGNQIIHNSVNLFEELKNQNISLKDSKEYITKNFVKEYDKTPFEIIREYNEKGIINQELTRVKMGKYSLIEKAIKDILNLSLDLNTIPKFEDLENITGLSFKTSRFFIIHSYNNVDCAALDTHILKFLKLNKIDNVPKSTPNNKNLYLLLEKKFLNILNKINKDIKIGKSNKNYELLKEYIIDENNLTLANFDLAIWLYMKNIEKEM